VPAWLTGPAAPLAAVAAKAALMYATALLGLRLAHRRTLAQWSAMDFAAAVAVGAIIGRTAVAGSQSYLTGAVALATLLAAHAAVTLARGRRWVGKLVDHRVRVLVAHGRLRRRQLLVCGVTDLGGLRYVLHEAEGQLTVVPDDAPADAPLVREALDAAAGSPRGTAPPGR
jgi:uncharacterized membrane protein YcaP (DUF421 family)